MGQRTLGDFSDGEMAVEESPKCPTCGKRDFASERGLQNHHSKVHDQPLTPSTAENPLSPVTREWLRRQYWGKDRSASEIADGVDVAANTVRRWMEDFDIERKDRYNARAGGNIDQLKDADWLREQYCQKGRNGYEIGQELGVTAKAVYSWMDRHGIERRTNAEASTDGDIEKLKNKDWLHKQYCNRERSAPEIAEDCGVESTTVYSYLEEHGIERRSIIEARTVEGDLELLQNTKWIRKQYWEEERSASDIAEECGVGLTTLYRWMDRHGIERREMSAARADGNVELLNNEEWIREQYIEKERSMLSLATELEVSHSTVRRNMARHGIERRSIAEAMTEGTFERLQDRGWLREQHIEEGCTATEIAEKIGVSPNTVVTWLDHHDIELQTRTNFYDPDHLGHVVRSQWERQFAELLIDLGVEYEYESMKIEYDDGRTYTPDFITQKYVIEVKGQVNDHAIRRAEGAMSHLSDREYVIVGSANAVDAIPADYQYRWSNRNKIRALFEKEQP